MNIRPSGSYHRSPVSQASNLDALQESVASNRAPRDVDETGVLEWNAWASCNGASHEKNEALSRIIQCSEGKNTCLDLSELGLLDLPNYLPEHIEELKLSWNLLFTLPSMPPSLKVLNVSNNILTCLPENLPDGLEELNSSHNRLKLLPERLPATLENLKLRCNVLEELSENLPGKL